MAAAAAAEELLGQTTLVCLVLMIITERLPLIQNDLAYEPSLRSLHLQGFLSP